MGVPWSLPLPFGHQKANDASLPITPPRSDAGNRAYNYFTPPPTIRYTVHHTGSFPSGASLSSNLPGAPARSYAGARAQNILTPPPTVRSTVHEQRYILTPPATPPPHVQDTSFFSGTRGRSAHLPTIQNGNQTAARTPGSGLSFEGAPQVQNLGLSTSYLLEHNYEVESSDDMDVDNDDYVPETLPSQPSTSGRPRLAEPYLEVDSSDDNMNIDDDDDDDYVPTKKASTSRRGRPRLSDPPGSRSSRNPKTPRRANPKTPRRGSRRSEPSLRSPQLEDYRHDESTSEDEAEDLREVEDMRQDLVDDNTDDIIPLVPLSSAEVEQAVLEMCNGSHVPQAETPQLEPTLGGHRLLPHQITGTKFMIYRENIENMKFGGILADETGLGKTAQACALIKYDHAKNPRKVRYHPTCVVVPKALTSQWEAECEKFLPGMKVAVYCNPKRHSIYQLLKSDIIITTYDTVRCEYALYQSSKDPLQCKDFLNGGVLRKQKNGRNLEKVELNDALFRIPFRRVVLDESHIIKNHTTERAAACYRLQSTFRWCLTATPMHNSVMEYHSQLRFLRISPYSDIDWFKTGIENPIGKKAGTGSKKAMRKLQLCLTQVLLRRHKDGYTDGVKNLDLPEVIVHCDPEATRLSCEEMEIYNALQDRFSAIVRQFELSTHCVFVLLLRLRQACLHPSLLLKTYKKDAQEILKRMNESEGGNRDDATEFDWHNGRAYCDLCGAKYSEIRDNSRAHKIACKETLRLLAGYSCVSGEQRTMSERVKAVFRTLRRIPKGEKVIVFSQFTSMLYVLQGFLIDEGMSFVRHDGSMDQKSRQKSLQVIRDQRSGVEIILMSLQASAFGLNLPQCNHVIFTDIWWNPAIEYQAISRVDRIDQKRQVHVYKLVADETIESRMLLMQEEKRKLAAMTLASDQLEEVKRLDKAQIIELITGRDPRRF